MGCCGGSDATPEVPVLASGEMEDMKVKMWSFSWSPCGVSHFWLRWEGECITCRTFVKYPFLLCCLPCVLLGCAWGLVKLILWGLVDFILLLGTLLSGGCCGKSCKMWSKHGCCQYDEMDAGKEHVTCTHFEFVDNKRYPHCGHCCCWGCTGEYNIPSMSEIWKGAGGGG